MFNVSQISLIEFVIPNYLTKVAFFFLSLSNGNATCQNQTIQVSCGIHVLYRCEGWTLTAGTERRTQAFEFTCFRKILSILKGEHETNMRKVESLPALDT